MRWGSGRRGKPSGRMTERALTVYCHASGVVEQALARREPEVEEGFRGGGARPRARSDTTLLTQDGPGGAQEGYKRGFIFFFSLLGAPLGAKRVVQERLQTRKSAPRRRLRHDHVENGRYHYEKAAQVRPKVPQDVHQTLRIVGFTRAKRTFFITLLNLILTVAGC